MKFGRADRRIALQASTLSTNAYGQRVASWTTYATVWAQLTYTGGDEKLQSDQVSSTIKTQFKIRYGSNVSAVKPSDRVVYDGNNYELLYIQEVGRGEALTLVCELRSA